MPRIKKDPTQKTSVAIAVAAHVVVGLLVFVWAAKTGRLDPMLHVIGLISTKKKEEKREEPKPPPPTEQPAQPSNLPPPPGGAARAATASRAAIGAPPPMGGSFLTAPVRPAGRTNFGGVFGGTGTNISVTAPARVAPIAAPVAAPVAAATAIAAPKAPPPPPPLATLARPSTIAQVFQERAKAAAAQDAIGSEQISKSAGGDAADVVAKVTGTSVVDGKFMVVRGLSDRYNNTTLNGAELPSADPYRKAAQVDLFSASQIDQIVTTKTFTPDQRGDFTGGAVNIITKSFPERRFFTFSLGTSYNTQANLSDRFLVSKGGDSDWAAIDDGTRALPAAVAAVPPAAVGANSARLIREFRNTQFAPTRDGSPLNQSYSFSLGDTLNFLGRPFGFFAGGNYGKSYSFYENGTNDRYDSAQNPKTKFTDARAIEEVNWGAVMNLTWAPLPEQEIGFNFLYNQSAEDMVRQQQGFDYTTGNSADTITHLNTLHYTERHLHTFQLKGRHGLPWPGNARLEWLTSLSATTQDEPDLRYFNYYSADDGLGGRAYYFDNSLPAPNKPTRYFRDLAEDNQNVKLDLTVPFRIWDGREAEFKTGAFQSTSERQFHERTFTYDGSSGFDTQGDPNHYLDNPAARSLSSPFGNQSYRGLSDVTAAYLMLDAPVTERLRLILGVRQETTDIRITNNDVASKPLQASDTLPALGLVYRLTAGANLRLNYGKTIARPTFREIANYESYDPSGDEILIGNPNLERTLVDNYDVRWEWFPRPGEVLSLGGFYKKLDKPIEKYLATLDGGKISYVNRTVATLYGWEFEVRKQLDFIDPLLAPFTLGGNFSYIHAEVPLTSVELFNKRSLVPGTPPTRPLYDQSPYIANLDLSYDNARSGTSASLLFNLTGERIYITLGKGPDIYEQPPATLDFVFTQRLRPGLKLKFTARNLTDPIFKRTYGAEESGKVYSANRKGRTLGLSLTLDF